VLRPIEVLKLQKQRRGVFGKIKGLFSGAYNSVKNLDNFGQPVPINFDGDDTFKTLPGGMLSICMLFYLCCYILLQFIYMINSQDWSLVQQTVLPSTQELSDPIFLRDEKNISLGLQFIKKIKKN
jgi:hypothetical protein